MQCIAVCTDTVDCADAKHCSALMLLTVLMQSIAVHWCCWLCWCNALHCALMLLTVLMQCIALCTDAVDCADAMHCTVYWCCWLCWCNTLHCALMLLTVLMQCIALCPDATTVLIQCIAVCTDAVDCADATHCTVHWCYQPVLIQYITMTTITIYFINPSGKLKLSFDRTMKNILQCGVHAASLCWCNVLLCALMLLTVLMQCIALCPDAVDCADAMYCSVPCMLPACADAMYCSVPWCCWLCWCSVLLCALHAVDCADAVYCTVPCMLLTVLMQCIALCPDAVDCVDAVYCSVPWCCWLCWCNVLHCALHATSLCWCNVLHCALTLPACTDALYCRVPCMLPACADAMYCTVPCMLLTVLMQCIALCPACCWLCWCNVLHCALMLLTVLMQHIAPCPDSVDRELVWPSGKALGW